MRLSFLMMLLIGTWSCGFSGQPAQTSADLQTGASTDTFPQRVGGGCEGCELYAAGMPKNLDWQTTVASASEPGERLTICGTILQQDGHTPAAGIILYFYHTNHKGLYEPAPGQIHARRNGKLRGWVKTGTDGRYCFHTIKPACYPKGRFAAHIHPTIKEPGLNEYYIDDFEFEGDPFLPAGAREKAQKRGGLGIIPLKKGASGGWSGERDIVLGLNIPNYPSDWPTAPETRKNRAAYDSLHFLLTENYVRMSATERRSLRETLQKQTIWPFETLCQDSEPGEKITLSGRVLDGNNQPVPNARLRIFHTDHKGFYSPLDAETGRMLENDPRLVGFLTTSALGTFEIRTIRPASYPKEYEGRLIPQHIHVFIEAEGFREGVFQIVFSDDPAMTQHWVDWAKKRGYPIVQLSPGKSNATGIVDLKIEPR